MVLKIIGIILLILLGLIFLIMFFALFVPVRYVAKGNFKDKDTYDFFFKVSWLLHILQFKVSGCAGNSITNRFTILGIRLRKKEKAENKKDERISRNNKKNKKDSGKSRLSDEEQKEDSKFFFDYIEEHEEGSEPERKGLFTKIKESVLSFIDKIRQICKKVCAAAASIVKNVQKTDEFIHDEGNYKIFDLAKGELLYLMTHFKPRKLRGELLFGTGDPATTGYAIGALYAFYPVYGNNLAVTPDFENKVIEGKLFFRGKIRGVHAVRTLLHLFMNKDFRNKLFNKNGGKNNGRK